MTIWILNGVHRTPDYHLRSLAKQACPEVLEDPDSDPEDPNSNTQPLMYDSGMYFLCDVVWDTSTHVYRIPYSKTYESRTIPQAYEKGTMNELRHMIGVGVLQPARRRSHAQRTNNRTSSQTIEVRSIRPRDDPLPEIGHSLDRLPLPDPARPQGPDVDYFHQHGGGNRPLVPPDDDPEMEPENPLKNRVQLILEQMFYDILHESPNRRSHSEGPWTNIPLALREQQATEDLYLHLEFPFDAVQYIVCTQEQWLKHFDHFFPLTVPTQPLQNFRKCRYFSSYLSLIQELRPRRLSRVRAELRTKFNSLAWVPHTESDRMWCTRKMASGRWRSLPDGDMKGPKIAINPIVRRALHGEPVLRPPPMVDDIQDDTDEEEE